MKSILTLVVILFIVLAVYLAQSDQDEDVSDYRWLRKTSRELNISLPRMIDQHTRFDHTNTVGNTLIYNYTLVNHLKSAFQVDIFMDVIEKQIVRTACTARPLLDLLNKGSVLRYVYRDREGTPVGRIEVDQGDCSEAVNRSSKRT